MVQSLPPSDGFRILFNSPELSEVQRSGFHLFLKKGIAEELSKISCIQLKHAQFLIEIVVDAKNFRLITPENNYRDCILKMKSYTCKLYVQTRIVFKDKVSGELLYQTRPEWVLLADLPMMTKRGHFVINGSPRVIVHQVGRAPGVYFKKVLKVKKDVNNKARFYGDIIPRKGVWVRLQINKKGEIDLKLKKSKKVRAEMVQKCLELLEKEESKLVLFKSDKAIAQPASVKLSSSFVSTNGIQQSLCKNSVFATHAKLKQNFVLLRNLLKQKFVSLRMHGKSRNGFFFPGSWGEEFLYSDNNHAESKNTKISLLAQKPFFFSPQTSSLAGIDKNNCGFSKTRQTQAFVTGLSLNKPETTIHPILYHAKPWLTAIQKSSAQVRMISRLQGIVNPTKFISVQSARFLSNNFTQTKFHLVFKPKVYQNGVLFPSLIKKSSFYKRAEFGLYARKTKQITKLMQKLCFCNCFVTPKLCYAKTKFLHGTTKLTQKRSLYQNPVYAKTKFLHVRNCFVKHDTNSRVLLINKAKTFSFDRVEQRLIFPDGTEIPELFSDNRLLQIDCSLSCKPDNPNFVSLLKNKSPDLTNQLSLPLGSKMYGKTRSAFTKAEKEAFSNVYTGFYKNDIQDIKERASMSFVKKLQNSTKQHSSSPTPFSVAKLSPQSKTKPFKKKVAPKKIVKKQNVSSNLEKIREYLYQLFKRSDLYDLGPVGREKINTKFGISVIETQLTALDIKETINWLSKLRAGKEEIDDIDHSQNRRVRTSSELIQTQFENGITRLRNVVTKKVRNGKIEQIKALPLTLRANLPRTKTKVLRCKNEVGAKTEFLHAHTYANLAYANDRLVGYRQSGDVSQLPQFKDKLTNPAFSDKPYFRGQGSCFVKNNKIIDKVKLQLQNKTTFTSINPYCITNNKKKKYYSDPSDLRSARQKLSSRRDLLRVFNQPCLETHQARTKTSFWYNLCYALPCKNEVFALKRSFCIKTNKYQNEVMRTKTKFWSKLGTSHGTAIAQDAVYPRNNQLSHFSVSELFSTKPINGALREFFSSSPLSQYMDQTNPLAEITHKRRISSLGVGGVSRESAGMAIRGIHPTHYGRVCPIETPEGKNAGLVNSLAFYAKINNQGFIETPYYQVIKGQIQHELGFSFVSAGQESRNGLYIAPNDIKQSKSKLLATNISTVESIPVRVADTVLDIFKKVSPYNVDCIGISPVQILSVATSLIPFLEHNDANRALMGSNMQRQAVSLMISERPLVGTGLEARVLAESGHLVQSKVSGFISSVSAHKVVVESLSHNLTFTSNKNPVVRCKNEVFALKRINAKTKFLPVRLAKTKLYQNEVMPELRSMQSCALRAKTKFWQDQNYVLVSKTKFLHVRHHVTKRSFVQANAKINVDTSLVLGNRLSSIDFLKEGTCQISLGNFSLLTSGKTKEWSVKEKTMNKAGLLPYLNLFKYRSSNSVIETSLPPTQPNKSRVFSFTKKKLALLPVTHSISTFSRSNQETCLVQKPLVAEGDWVQKGDMVSDCSAGQKGELSVGKNMLIAYIPWQGYNFEDAIVISDRLVKEQLYTSLHIERYTVIVNDFKDKVVDTNEWFTGNLPGVDNKKRDHLQRSGLPVIGTILREGDILVGKIKYSKKKPATPHEKLVCDILGEHNFSVQNSSLYVPKGVHEARVLTYKIKKRFEKALQNNLRPAGAPKVVDIFLGEKRNIQVGDKMSGRHGNKGIVSTILPKQDMPYLADGSPIDILLNPLGVPSRMNVGQVFECLLGLASTYLQQNFKMTAFDELYGVEASQSLVFLKLYQARLQSGQNWLFQVNFPGKTRLTDGRSGECLDQWVTVGRAYMLKLIHMVNEKIHARAIGPYALVTQQPLKGRAHKGGQRLGEMEVWAVEGFGAAYILQELLTKKSDDSIGRKEVLKAMLPKSASFLDFVDPFNQSVQTEPRLELDNVSTHSKKENRLHNEGESFNVLGQPDIFKVLICELQALCLDVGVYSMKTESFQRQFLGILE